MPHTPIYFTIRNDEPFYLKNVELVLLPDAGNDGGATRSIDRCGLMPFKLSSTAGTWTISMQLLYPRDDDERLLDVSGWKRHPAFPASTRSLDDSIARFLLGKESSRYYESL